MKVTVDVSETEVEGDYGALSGLCLTCSRCGHEVEVFGTEEASEQRGAVVMREECPKGEQNFYVVSNPHWIGDFK